MIILNVASTVNISCTCGEEFHGTSWLEYRILNISNVILPSPFTSVYLLQHRNDLNNLHFRLRLMVNIVRFNATENL